MLAAALACAPAAGQSRLWTARFDGGGGADPNASTWKRALAVDGAGNTYATGSITVGTESDCLVVRYAPDGGTVWSAVYSGSRWDYCYAVAADAAGNVYAAGGQPFGDAFLLKYDASGTLLWARTYAGSAGFSDYARNLALDATGHVYVTGFSYTRMGDEGEVDADSFTLKYDSAGNRLWARTWGLPLYEERFEALALDASGNPVVSGTGGHVIKYAAADGAELWHAQPSQVSSTEGLAVDASGAVLVTGAGWDGANWSTRTVKLAASGTEQWGRTYGGGSGNYYNGGQAVGVDEQGDVYVAGALHQAPALDILTLKYASDGTPLWARVWDGPGAGDDRAFALAVEAGGRVFVGGFSATAPGSSAPTDRRVLAYDPDGTLLWTAADDGGSAERVLALALRPGGGVMAFGPSSDTDGDLRTTAYDRDGALLWVAEEPPLSAGPDRAAAGAPEQGRHALAVTSDGRAYVTGSSRAGSEDLSTLAYEADGTLAWSRRLDLAGALDQGSAVGLDAAGKIYVAGRSGEDTLLARYAPDGTLAWVRTWNAPENGSDMAFDLAVSPAGESHLTGWSAVPGGSGRVLTLKYGSDGTLLWSRFYNSPGPSPQDAGEEVALDAAGNVYVAGERYGGGLPYAGLLLKYSPDGTLLWSRALESGTSDSLRLRALAVDPSGRAALVGSVDGGSGAVLAAFEPDGTPAWERRRGAGGRYEAVVFTPSGRLVAAGAQGSDFDVVAYGGDGTLLWAGPAGVQGHAYAVAVDAGEGVYATGYLGVPAAPTSDYRTLRLDADGSLAWVDDYAGPAGKADAACSVAVASGGDAVVTGTSFGLDDDVATLRYRSAGADLALTLSGPAAPVSPSSAFAYTLTAEDVGPLPSGPISLQQQLPAGVGFVSAGGSAWSCSAPVSGLLQCSHSGLGPGTQAALLVNLTAPAQGGLMSTNATLSGGLVDPQPANNSALAATPVMPAGGASITISDGQWSAVPGVGLTYTITVMSAEASPVSVWVTGDIPLSLAGLSWICAASAGSSCTAGSGLFDQQASLAAGGHVRYELSASIDPAALGTLETGVSVVVPGGYPDPDPTDNTAADSDVLTPRTDLAVTLVDGPDPVAIQGTLAYTASAANGGPSASSGGLLTLTLPAGLQPLSTPAGCGLSGGTVSCGLPDLAPGASVQFDLQVRPGPGTLGAAQATAQVDPGAPASDPQSGNDTASATTSVVFVKGDLSHDLATDLLLRNRTSGEMVAWLMNGVARQAAVPLSPPPAPEWLPQGLDDFDGDGHTDLVLRHATTGEVRFWLLNGTSAAGTLPLLGAPTLAANWKLSATADFDHDGWPDLLWRNVTSQKLVVWTMSGHVKTSTLVPSPSQAVDGNWEIVAARDYDGDGHTDLLWYNQTSGRIVQWLMDAQLVRTLGRFTSPMGAGDANWKVWASGDYGVGPGGQPGTNDLVWRNATSGRYVVWHLDLAGLRTAGVFTDPWQPEGQPLEWEIAGPR